MYICIYIYVYIHIYTYIYLQSHPPTLASLSVSMFVSCLFKAFQSNTTPSFHKESREGPLQCVFRTVTHHVFAHYFIFTLVTACMNGLQRTSTLLTGIRLREHSARSVRRRHICADLPHHELPASACSGCCMTGSISATTSLLVNMHVCVLHMYTC